MEAKTFGEYFKELRIRKGITLREFCVTHDLDPGNLSKLERGELNPPQDIQKLKDYAFFLGLKEGSRDFQTFMDLAAASAGRIPPDLAKDKELIGRLPVLFRTLRGKKLDKEALKELIAKLRSV